MYIAAVPQSVITYMGEVYRMFPLSDGALDSKLLGHCEWPLSISLPKDVTISSPAGTAQSYRLPETFLERHIHTKYSVQIDYPHRARQIFGLMVGECL